MKNDLRDYPLFTYYKTHMRDIPYSNSQEHFYSPIKSKLGKMKKKGRPVRMCEVAQALEEKGIKKGVKKERIRTIQRMLLRGDSKESILGLDYTEQEYAKAESKLMESV